MVDDSKKTIVLADDEQFIRAAYKDGLERAGYKIVTAENGEEAFAAVEKSTPDLLLLDLIMPKLNGFDTLKKLKADEKYKDLKVVILTNLSQDTDKEEVTSLGAIDFVVKSDYSMQEIVDKVAGYLK